MKKLWFFRHILLEVDCKSAMEAHLTHHWSCDQYADQWHTVTGRRRRRNICYMQSKRQILTTIQNDGLNALHNSILRIAIVLYQFFFFVEILLSFCRKLMETQLVPSFLKEEDFNFGVSGMSNLRSPNRESLKLFCLSKVDAHLLQRQVDTFRSKINFCHSFKMSV